jgi:hypothetical protein
MPWPQSHLALAASYSPEAPRRPTRQSQGTSCVNRCGQLVYLRLKPSPTALELYKVALICLSCPWHTEAVPEKPPSTVYTTATNAFPETTPTFPALLSNRSF